MGIYDLVLKNRSYRSFDAARAVTEEELRTLVEAARICPSAANRQPLRYRPCCTPEDMKKVLPHTNGRRRSRNGISRLRDTSRLRLS